VAAQAWQIAVTRSIRCVTILLLRHGETALNAARVMQPADTPLSVRGRLQASRVAQRVRAMAPVALLSSDLPRALQTAQAVAAATGLPISTEALLQERNFGDWRGRPHAGFDFDPVMALQAPPGGESMADFLARVARAWACVSAWRAGLAGPLVVVSHGLVIHAMLARHARLDSGGPELQRLANTSLSIIDAAPPHRLRHFNCTDHLAGVADDDGQSLSGG
jgi:broad specificity phosphatase PhoE